MSPTVVEADLDIEHKLICRILTEPDDWTAVVKAQIKDEFFQNPKHRKVWDRIYGFWREYHALPTLDILRRDFPRETYTFYAVDESVDFLIAELRKEHKGALIELGMSEIATLWESGDYDEASRIWSATDSQIHRDLPVADDMDLTKSGPERLEWYRERRDNGDELLGIPTGLVSLDKATGGYQPETLTVIVGFAKHGKSDVLLHSARTTHEAGEIPLVISFEMANREQAERYDARRAGVSLTRLRNGTLTPEEWERLERAVLSIPEGMHSFILSADRTSTMTLSGLQAKIDMIRPTIVFVDGVYMMDDEEGEPKGSPRALTNLTRGFKRMAQRNKLPIAITTQALEGKDDRKRGLTRRSIGYSSSFIQDGDTIIGVERSEEDPSIQNVKILASRNCPPQDFYIRRDWDRGTLEELDYNPFESDGADDDGGDYGGF